MKRIHKKEEIGTGEARMVYHNARHEIPFLVHQCPTDVLRALFALSSIAKSLSSRKTKGAAIVTNIFAVYLASIFLKEIEFASSLAFDTINKSNIKPFPLRVQYFSDVEVKKGYDPKFESIIPYSNAYVQELLKLIRSNEKY